jgi:hypothetical protein
MYIYIYVHTHTYRYVYIYIHTYMYVYIYNIGNTHQIEEELVLLGSTAPGVSGYIYNYIYILLYTINLYKTIVIDVMSQQKLLVYNQVYNQKSNFNCTPKWWFMTCPATTFRHLTLLLRWAMELVN